MNLRKWNGALLVGLSLVLGVAGGYWFAQQGMSEVPGAAPEQSLPLWTNAKCCIGTTLCPRSKVR